MGKMRPSSDKEKLVVSGEDLVMPTPETLGSKKSDPSIFLSVPANPLYWIGTRLSSVASGYQMYRPLEFTVSYVPQVPVTYSGNVIYGTLFSDGREMASLQQSLASSNGGGITPCYTPAKSRVKLGEQLPQKLFRVKGNAADSQVNPFRWVATYSGSNPSGESTSAPGWIVVKWTYEFVGGIGNGGDSVATIYTTPPEAAEQLSTHLESVGLRVDRAISPLFGTVIGVLKMVGIQVLRNVAVLFLENTRALANGDNTLFGAGAMAAVAPPSKQEALNSDTTIIRDGAGNEWEVSDDTPVVIYEQGPVVSASEPTPPVDVFTITELSVDCIGYPSTDQNLAVHLKKVKDDPAWDAIGTVTTPEGYTAGAKFKLAVGASPQSILQLEFTKVPLEVTYPTTVEVILNIYEKSGTRQELKLQTNSPLYCTDVGGGTPPIPVAVTFSIPMYWENISLQLSE